MSVLVGVDAPVDDVGEASLERPAVLGWGLAFVQLAQVVAMLAHRSAWPAIRSRPDYLITKGPLEGDLKPTREGHLLPLRRAEQAVAILAKLRCYRRSRGSRDSASTFARKLGYPSMGVMPPIARTVPSASVAQSWSSSGGEQDIEQVPPAGGEVEDLGGASSIDEDAPRGELESAHDHEHASISDLGLDRAGQVARLDHRVHGGPAVGLGVVAFHRGQGLASQVKPATTELVTPSGMTKPPAT
jgi:hypothetical protein